MKYPAWAPPELVDLLGKQELEEKEFNPLNIGIESLNSYAWNKGSLNWNEYEKIHDFKVAATARLITRPEMESVWKWVTKQNFKLPLVANGGLFGNFFMAVDTWYSTAQVPQSERNDDFKEIAKLARTLSVKLQKYRGELHQPINSYMALFPSPFKEKYQKKYDERDVNNPKQYMLPINHLALTIPTLSELLNQLANLALNDQIDLPSYFPKKINAENAFRTYLINNMIQKIYLFGSTPPPTIVSKFIGVALDDYSVTPDIVRKSVVLKVCRSEALKYGQLRQSIR